MEMMFPSTSGATGGMPMAFERCVSLVLAVLAMPSLFNVVEDWLGCNGSPSLDTADDGGGLFDRFGGLDFGAGCGTHGVPGSTA